VRHGVFPIRRNPIHPKLGFRVRVRVRLGFRVRVYG